MADNETSKITWIAITVALAGSIYGVASSNLPKLAETTLNKASKIVDSIGSKTDTENTPDSTDAKWVEKGNFGDNGYFVRDADGNGIVYALDTSKPVIAPNQSDASRKFVRVNNNLKTLKFLNKTVLPENASWYFSENKNLESFTSENLDTSNVTSMHMLFYNNKALTTLDISHFDTSNVTSMAYMFDGLTSLTSLDVSHFDTSNVTSMAQMFYGDSALTALDVSHFDTSKVTNMAQMFYGNESLTSLDLSNFNTSNVTSMSWMFYSAKTLTSLDLSHFDTSNVTDMTYMFCADRSLTSLNLSNFDMSKITDVANVSNMFTQLSNLKTIKLDNTTASKLDPYLSSVFGSYIIDIDVAMQKQIAGALFTVPV